MKTASLLLLLSVDVVVSASLGHSDGLQKRQAGLSSITAKLGTTLKYSKKFSPY